jgi:hypothetical protein
MRRSAFVPTTAPALAFAACRDSLDNLGLRGRGPALEYWPRRSNRRGFLFQSCFGGLCPIGRLQMLDPFTVVATAVGFVIVASLMLAAIEQ